MANIGQNTQEKLYNNSEKLIMVELEVRRGAQQSMVSQCIFATTQSIASQCISATQQSMASGCISATQQSMTSRCISALRFFSRVLREPSFTYTNGVVCDTAVGKLILVRQIIDGRLNCCCCCCNCWSLLPKHSENVPVLAGARNWRKKPFF